MARSTTGFHDNRLDYNGKNGVATFSPLFLAHLSRRLIGELIVYPCSGVHRRWPIKAKFYVEPHWEGGTKVCINGPGHKTKMAAMPIYGKNLKKSSSPEPAGRFP